MITCYITQIPAPLHDLVPEKSPTTTRTNMSEKINSNPTGEFQGTLSLTGGYPLNSDKVDGVDIAEEEEEPIDSEEIFDLLRSINDPEHPLTLEQLKVVSAEQITVSPNHVMVRFTADHSSLQHGHLIGLSMRGSSATEFTIAVQG
ncbi:Iron-sulfur cluster assembly protein [Rhizoctonia solani]|uniref:Iron-sulfur cluster assembly protein n=1 Tax=Rhizoctonia solani TaxID=456999 RepID=A0A8H7IHJ9_9AGAM|nr:Iron-sulfur cluster assembly protein [Rhizoctonia solani]